MKKIIITIILATILIILAGCNSSASNSEIQIFNNNQDLGDISIMGGTVDAKFTLQNIGDEPVTLTNASSSCMCTVGILKNSNGYQSPDIQMTHGGGGGTYIGYDLTPGESLELIATFDPLAHGPNAVGPISRGIDINTNSSKSPRLKFSFSGNVIK